MKKDNSISRRFIVKSSIFGLIAVSTSNILSARNVLLEKLIESKDDTNCSRYPAIADATYPYGKVQVG